MTVDANSQGFDIETHAPGLDYLIIDAPGWSDISGNITATNPFGARIDVRTRFKNFTLKVNGRGVQP